MDAMKSDNKELKQEITKADEEKKAMAMAAFVRKVKNLIGVSYVYTAPEHRRKGYGQKLMVFLETLARKRELDVFLHVEKNNVKALSLYESLGYERHSEFWRYSKKRK